MTKIKPNRLRQYGFTDINCAEYDWEKRYRSIRKNEDGTCGESIFGLIRWGDGTYEAYITTAELDTSQQSSCIIREVNSMEQILKLYTAITDQKITLIK